LENQVIFKEKINILHVNTHNSGGAYRATARLNSALESFKINTKILNKSSATRSFKGTNIFNIYQKVYKKIFKPIGITETWQIEVYNNQIINTRSDSLEIINIPVSEYDITEEQSYKTADIVHLHWVGGFLDWPTFFSKNKKPVVWTLHDMNPFKGFEHIEEPYYGIDNDGYPLPRVRSNKEVELSEYWLQFKKNIIAGVDNITIVSPSKWLLEKSENSGIFSRFRHVHIPNSVPEQIFFTKDKALSRKKLGLPLDKTIFLFVANDVNNRNKGFEYLYKSLLEPGITDDLYLCAIGAVTASLPEKNVISLGQINNEEQMADIYAAADAFIIPSLEDNLPNTMLESLMCGTPVIGFPVGGIQETIQDGFNGYMCERIGVPPLVETLKKFLENADSFSREAIAEDALKKYATQIQVQAYLDLYRSLV
jgi:glycosyltransferase involved in cell wall biosynthesis